MRITLVLVPIALLLIRDPVPSPILAREQAVSGESEWRPPTYFNLNSSTIRRDQIVRLGEIVDTLERNVDRSITVSGQADDRESPVLARRRADSVRRFLIAAGIAESRIQIDEDAAPKLCTVPREFCWQRDRRVDYALR